MAETLYSFLAFGFAMSLIAPTNLVGFVVALRGIQAGIEPRALHVLALLLNGLYPGAIIVLIYYLNRGDLIRYFVGFGV